MSAAEVVAELIAGGMSRAAIGRAIGRDQRQIGQIASGRRGPNYGAQLEGPLRELREQLAQATAAGRQLPAAGRVVDAPRRQTKAGELARVRKPMSHGGERWGVSTTKRQATNSGAAKLAPQLAGISHDGRRAAVTLTLAPGVNVAKSGKRRQHGGDQDVDVDIPDVDELLELVDAHGGNVTEALAELLTMSDRAEAVSAADIRGIELRSWTE